MKRTVPLVLTFTMGVLMFAQYFIPHPLSQAFYDLMLEWARIIGIFALVIGLSSLIRVHYGKIKRKFPGWGYSIVTLAALFITALIGLFSGTEDRVLHGSNPDYVSNLQKAGLPEETMAKLTAIDLQTVGSSQELEEKVTASLNALEIQKYKSTVIASATKVSHFKKIFDYILIPLQATMFSLLAFYITSAAYRAFRARNWQASLLLLAGVLVMLGRIPFGDMMWSGMSELTRWIMLIPTTAAMRGIALGVGLGVIATSLKIILGIERGYLGGSR